MNDFKLNCIYLSAVIILTAGCSQADLRGRNASAASHVVEGQQLMAKGDYRNAIFELTRAINLDPKNGNAYLDRSQSYSKLAEYDKAVQDAEEALRLLPTDNNGYLRKATAELGQKNFKAALADLKKVQDSGDKKLTAQVHLVRSRCYLAQGQTASAISELETSLQQSTKESQEFAIQRILCQVRAHQYGQAKNALQQLIIDSPQNASLLAMLGAVYALSGDNALAIAQFREAIKNQQKESLVEMVDLDASNRTPAAVLASTYLEHSPTQAVAFIADLRSQRQLEEEEQFQLARAYLAMNQDQKAVKVLNSCLSSVPDDMNVRLELIRVYKKQGLPEKAREVQNESLPITTSATDRAVLNGLAH